MSNELKKKMNDIDFAKYIQKEESEELDESRAEFINDMTNSIYSYINSKVKTPVIDKFAESERNFVNVNAMPIRGNNVLQKETKEKLSRLLGEYEIKVHKDLIAITNKNKSHTSINAYTEKLCKNKLTDSFVESICEKMLEDMQRQFEEERFKAKVELLYDLYHIEQTRLLQLKQFNNAITASPSLENMMTLLEYYNKEVYLDDIRKQLNLTIPDINTIINRYDDYFYIRIREGRTLISLSIKGRKVLREAQEDERVSELAYVNIMNIFDFMVDSKGKMYPKLSGFSISTERILQERFENVYSSKMDIRMPKNSMIFKDSQGNFEEADFRFNFNFMESDDDGSQTCYRIPRSYRNNKKDN